MSSSQAHNALVEEMIASAVAPIGREAFEQEVCDATEDLLLVVEPLIDLARGDKRARIRAAFLRTAAASFRRRTRDFSTPLPASPRGVALELHRTVLQLCQAHGLGAMDLLEAYQDLLDDPKSMANQKADSFARLKSLTALLIGQEHVTR
ncbi:hypothetical protein sos41_31530 [Alphaproteobacteria bacterium SO-S41]|nr:hypothetical protein sos41_31530 [Alphaproteobacteria bacterium SO-S41]